MVRGLDKFREQFRSYAGQYVLVGGTACDLLMGEAGLDFRATKDVDMVLMVEALEVGFVKAFWAFVRAGKYQVQQRATGKKRYYRFLNPQHDDFPFMLELFARKPDLLDLAEGSHLTPIPMDEEISSLSAILLSDVYYAFLHAGKRVVEDLPVVGPEYLIPLKARAWLDLMRRKAAGDAIDSKSITKHKNDVFRLYRIIDPGFKHVVPKEIQDDMDAFLGAMASEQVDVKNLGIKGQDLISILDELRRLYVSPQELI